VPGLSPGASAVARCARARAPHPWWRLASVLAGPPLPGADEVGGLATEAMEAHLDRRLRSVRSVAHL